MVRRFYSDVEDHDGSEAVVGVGETFEPRAALPGWARNMRSTKPAAGPRFGFNELRWGAQTDLLVRDLAAPGLYSSGPQVQFGQVTEPRSRVWSLDIALEWVNFDTAVGAEALRALFVIQNGVGSGKLNRLTTITVSALASAAVVNIPNVPAATIYISAALEIITLGPGPRPDIVGRVGFAASPFFRSDDP